MDSSSGIGQLHNFDQNCTLLINGWRWSWSDSFWVLMSDKAVWIPAYLICAYFLFRRLGWKKALLVLASVVLSFAICDQLSTMVKYSVLRLRPGYSSRMLREGLAVLESRGGFYGFFSAHAANAYSVVLCLIIGFRNDPTHTYNGFCKWALGWAMLISVSRIFVGKHYFGDVVVGAAIGILVGYFVGMLTRFVIQKYVDRVPVTGLTMILDKDRLATIRAKFAPSGSPSTPSRE